MADILSQKNYYEKIGFTQRVGFGKRPAILVIDMCRGITEAGNPLYIDMEAAMGHMNDMFAIARGKGIPIIYTTGAFSPPHFADGGTFIKKIPLLRTMVPGSPLVDINPKIAPAEGEILMVKKYPSGFYGTNMASLLAFLQIDTTIVVGNSTSGCVRATVCDAVSAGFHVIIPRECVADRVPLSHEVALFDMDSKYGDVMGVVDVNEYLSTCAPNTVAADPIPVGAAS